MFYSARRENLNLSEWSDAFSKEIVERRADIVSASGNRIAHLNALQLEPLASIVHSLNLQHNRLSTDGAFALRTLTGLTTLNLSYNRLTQAQFLGWMPHLTDLDLSHNSLMSLELTLGNPEIMINLNLSHNSSADAPRANSLPRAMLLRMPRIRNLNLAYTSLTLAANDPVANALSFGTLQELFLDDATLLGYTECDFLASATRLRTLSLNACVELCVVPPVIKHLRDLHVLNMRSCVSLGVLTVYPEVHASTLREIDVSGCNLHAVDARLACLTNLRKLQLGGGNERLDTLPPRMAALTRLHFLSLNVNGWRAHYFHRGLLMLAARAQKQEGLDAAPAIVALTTTAAVALVTRKWSEWHSTASELEALPLMYISQNDLQVRRWKQIAQWDEKELVSVGFGSLGSLSLPRTRAYDASKAIADIPWDEDVDLGEPLSNYEHVSRSVLAENALYRQVSDLLYGYVNVDAELADARAIPWLQAAAHFLFKLRLTQLLALQRHTLIASPLQVLERLLVYWITHPTSANDTYPSRGAFNMLNRAMRGQYLSANALPDLYRLYLSLARWFGQPDDTATPATEMLITKLY